MTLEMNDPYFKPQRWPCEDELHFQRKLSLLHSLCTASWILEVARDSGQWPLSCCCLSEQVTHPRAGSGERTQAAQSAKEQ